MSSILEEFGGKSLCTAHIESFQELVGLSGKLGACKQLPAVLLLLVIIRVPE